MKELSIKQKAQRYDEAIEQLRAMMPNWENLSYNGKTFLQDLVHIIPELKESEDEKIRKTLIKYFRNCISLEGINGEDISNWLEKQGNLMKALQISNARIGELIEKNYYLKEQLEKQGELKKHDVCDNCEQQGSCVSPCPMKLVEKQGEQNPVIKMKTPEESLGIDSDTYNKIVDECVYGEQKPAEWSEEDEELHRKCICAMRASACGFPEEEKFVEQVDNWLKSLKDRLTWKPSDEQIKALEGIKDYVALTSGYWGQTMTEIIKQLKQL